VTDGTEIRLVATAPANVGDSVTVVLQAEGGALASWTVVGGALAGTDATEYRMEDTDPGHGGAAANAFMVFRKLGSNVVLDKDEDYVEMCVGLGHVGISSTEDNAHCKGDMPEPNLAAVAECALTNNVLYPDSGTGFHVENWPGGTVNMLSTADSFGSSPVYEFQCPAVGPGGREQCTNLSNDEVISVLSAGEFVVCADTY